MKACGMSVDAATGMPSDPQYRKHVQEIWPIFQSFVETLENAEYLDRLPPGEPFADWSHHDRYAHGGYCGRSDVEAIGTRPTPSARSSRRRGRMVLV